MYYPKECFHINEDITRARRAVYDAWMDKVWEETSRRCPAGYSKTPVKVWRETRRQVETEILCPV